MTYPMNYHAGPDSCSRVVRTAYEPSCERWKPALQTAKTWRFLGLKTGACGLLLYKAILLYVLYCAYIGVPVNFLLNQSIEPETTMDFRNFF